MASLFEGAKLLKNNGGEATSSVLEGKIVGIYFSAHWCPPCRGFTPLLRDFYAELEDGGEFEIVFASSDRSENDLKNYLMEAHGDWYYLPFGDPLKQILSAKFEVRGIPTLIIVNQNGELITKDGRDDVESKAPLQALNGWKA